MRVIFAAKIFTMENTLCQYNQSGSAIIKSENELPYPRLCAHRGFSVIAPENSMPAFGAAVAMDADEIEFDLRITSDGKIVSCHDPDLQRVSNGIGMITDKTFDELMQYDFGSKFSDKFAGLNILTFEDILKKFSCQTIMNIHIKPIDSNPYPTDAMEKIIALIRKYGCEKHCYLMLETDRQITMFKEYASDIPICVAHLASKPWSIVDRAIEFGCQKVQFIKPWINREMIEKAHAHGIKCNVYWADDPKEALEFLDMGVDTILTNNLNIVANAVKKLR